MPATIKMKFAGLLRGLLRRFDDEAYSPQAMRPVSASAPITDVSEAAVSQQAVQTFSAQPPVSGNPNEIRLPLQPVLASLPMELRAKIMAANTAGMTIAIPVEKALAQLATGSVKITFGELRQLAPGVFANSGGEYDAKLVALPLNQILTQINPTLFSRRSTQKQIVEVADDISSPFDGRGQGLTISTTQMKAPVTTPPPQPPLSRFVTPAPETPVRPQPVTPPPPAFVHRAVMPATNGNHPSPQNGNGAHAKNNGADKFDAFTIPAAPALNSAPLIPIDQPVLAPLAALSESWPEALRLEIKQLDLTNAQVALPPNLIEPALKRGRIIFSWRYVRGWIKPTPPGVSVHDAVELELPLKVIAPLFFTHPQNGAAHKKKVSVAEEIPNLFFGFPQPIESKPAAAPVTIPPQAVAAAIPPLPDTNFFIRPNQPQTTDSEFQRKGGTDFKNRGASPGEIVSRAMTLPGVAGAVIALPDGLKVASHVPSDLNSDTLAAFLPQIFARVNQCSRELRMGDLNNLSFTVGNVPWKIFRVNAVYFAAFGRHNESLPSAQLAALAVELDHKKQ